MKENMAQIHSFPLFKGIRSEDLAPMLSCLGSYFRCYKKGELIFLSDAAIKCVGIIMSGTVHMIKEDILGNKTVLTFLKQGELFGETFACGSSHTSSVTFYNATDCRVLFLPFHKIVNSCNMSCIFHHRLIENMVGLIADKNAQLMEKIEITSKKSLRDKIVTYLTLQSQFHHSDYFEIPLARLELADYLCADRSALTRELNSMKAEGLIDFDKNTFHLHF